MPTAMEWIRERFSLTGASWPPRELAKTWEEIERFRAFRQSDDAVLRQIAYVAHWERYLLSPVPRMISRASANLLHGEPAEYKAADDADQENLDRIVMDNDLDTEAHRAAMIASSEGEVWGRICVRPALLDVPIIEFVSRRGVIPHFAGRFLLGATFVTEWPTGSVEVMRLFEHYEPGVIQSELYRGTRTALGQPIDLAAFEQTKGIEETVLTGIQAPLVAFIPNSIDDDPGRGYSDYAGLEERFLAINRATTIGDANTELAGEQRALVDGDYQGKNGSIQSGNVYVNKREMTGETVKPLQMLEYEYRADQITAWLDHLIDSTLGFGGASPQLVGRQIDGAAVSGIALRLKMIHSLLEASGKGRFNDRGHARLLHFAQIIDSRPMSEIGFGRPWAKQDEKPTVDRQDGLPTDDLEAAQQLQLMVGSEAISIDERVRFLHPGWTREQIDDEVKKLAAEAEQPVRLPR